MTVFINESKKLCFQRTESLRTATLLGRLERCFADRSAWDTRFMGIRRVTAPDICNHEPMLTVLLSDLDMGIYVAQNSYLKQIAQKAGLCSGLEVYTCGSDKKNQLEIGIGQDEDVEMIYFQLRQMMLALPFWI